MAIAGGKPGLVGFHRLHMRYAAGFRVRAGPFSSNVAPLGAGRKACGTECGCSPAPVSGALRGGALQKG